MKALVPGTCEKTQITVIKFHCVSPWAVFLPTLSSGLPVDNGAGFFVAPHESYINVGW